MTDQVVELAPGDIQRGSGISAGGEQPQQREGGGSVEVPQMGADQQAALKEVDRLRGEYGKTPSGERDAVMQRMSKLSRFAHGIGEKPFDFLPGDPPPPDMREHDSLRSEFEKELQPATELQTKALVNGAVIQGLDRGLAQNTADICAALDLGEVQTKIMLDRVQRHHGANHEFSADKDIRALDEAGIAEYVGEASKRFGSYEKFQAVSERARDFLAHKGALALLDKHAITRSTLSFDPFLLTLLASAADAAGVPKRGRK
jgi:hypothetical protein